MGGERREGEGGVGRGTHRPEGALHWQKTGLHVTL